MWYMWQRDDVVWDEGNILTRAYAPAIMVMAAMFSGSDSLPAPTEQEFRLLCWEFHNLSTYAPLDSIEARTAISVMRARLGSRGESERIRNIPEDEFRYVWLDLGCSSILDHQGRAFAYRMSDSVRAFLIYKRMAQIAEDAGLGNRFRAVERSFLRTEWRTFLRASIALIGMTGQDACGPLTPGRIDLGRPSGPDTPQNGVAVGDLMVVADGLAADLSCFPQLANDLKGLADHACKHHEHLLTLISKPVMRLDAGSTASNQVLLIPSPWHFCAATATLLLDDFAAALQADDEYSRNAWSDLGTAFHGHLTDVLTANPAVRSVDKLTSSPQGPIPDFVWVGDDYGLLIEAKVNLTPRSDPFRRDPMTLVEGWRRAGEAIDQAAHYLARDLDGVLANKRRPTRWVLLIVTHQPLGADVTVFRTAAKRWGWLSGTGLDALAIVSPAEIEHFGLFGDPDHYGAQILAAWCATDPRSLQQPREGVPFDERRVGEHVHAGWRELLPEVACPWSK